MVAKDPTASPTGPTLWPFLDHVYIRFYSGSSYWTSRVTLALSSPSAVAVTVAVPFAFTMASARPKYVFLTGDGKATKSDASPIFS